MDLISQIVERAKANKQRIVLPEGTEERTLKAANQILTDGVADLILLGNPDEIMSLAKQWGLGIDAAPDPKKEPKILSDRSGRCADGECNRRRARDVSFGGIF